MCGFVFFALAGCAEAPALEDASPSPAAAEQSSKPAKPVHKKVRVTKPIPFATRTIETSDLLEGERELQQAGQAGVRVRVVRVTSKRGKVIDRDLVRTFVAREPIERVVLVGDPSRVSAGAWWRLRPELCRRVCAGCQRRRLCGGSGDGPAYVDGPVQVVGDDIYDLNRDSDDIACDS